VIRCGVKLAVTFLLVATTAVAADVAIDVERSTISIHVGKAGLFSAAGHEHWVDAPIASGTMSETAPAHVEFTVEAARMIVRADAKVDANTYAQIQKDMEEMTLAIKTYPVITFRSSRVEKLGEGQWKVAGDLSLHGVTRQVQLMVTRTGGAFTAHTVLKQTDFGIKPVSIGGGVVKVKNELEIDFQIFPRPA